MSWKKRKKKNDDNSREKKNEQTKVEGAKTERMEVKEEARVRGGRKK